MSINIPANTTFEVLRSRPDWRAKGSYGLKADTLQLFPAASISRARSNKRASCAMPLR
jgi:hypothetical protein